MRIRTSAAILAIALTSAACASNGGTSSGGAGYGGATSGAVVPSTSGQGATGGKYSYGSPSTSGGSGGSGPASLAITQANYQFTPSTPSAKQGARIRIKNSTTTTPHTFTIPGTPVDITVDPSTSQTVALDLPPGTYPFMCRFHAASGMTGTLTITAK
jgi:plastocyanin